MLRILLALVAIIILCTEPDRASVVPSAAKTAKRSLSAQNIKIIKSSSSLHPAAKNLFSLTTGNAIEELPPSQTAVTANEPIEDKWALVIGVSKFADPTIRTLTLAAKDAEDFADFLVKKANFAKDHVLVLTNENAKRENILDAFGQHWLPQRVGENDLVVFYASTHGSAADKAEENYIVAYNTEREKLFSTGIRLQDLAPEIKKRTGCQRVVLFLDACHSGAAADSNEGEKGMTRVTSNFDVDTLAGAGTVVISSSKKDEISYESKRYQNSVFTHNLMNSLLINGPQTKLNAAYQDLKEKVQQEVRFDRSPASQVPQMNSKFWKGEDLMLAGKPAHPHQVLPDLIEPSYSTPDLAQSTAQSAATISARNELLLQKSAMLQSNSASAEKIALVAPSTLSGQAKSAQGEMMSAAGSLLYGQATITKRLPDNVALFPFRAPAQYDLSSTGSFGEISANNRKEVEALPAFLYQDMYKNLNEKLGVQLISPAILSAAVKNTDPAKCPGAAYWKQIGQLAGAKYLITGSITSFIFRGKVLMSNDYILTADVYLLSGETGQIIWRSDKHRFKRTPWAGDMKSGFIAYLEKKMLPSVGDDLCDEILKALHNH